MRVGTVCYATEQGLAVLARDFHRAGVVHEALVFRHPKWRTPRMDWWPVGTPVISGRPFERHHRDVVDAFLSRVQACVFFETPFCWEFPNLCRRRGVRTTLVPMHEWTPERLPAQFDKWACPSLLDLDYFRDMPGAEFIPIPACPSVRWRRRGRAANFLHNAGHVGARNHKGTEEVLRAVRFLDRGTTLKVTCQDAGLLRRLLDGTGAEAAARERGVELLLEAGDRDVADLFDWADVYVAPEKLNGLSLPLQEAFAAGCAVATTDRYPANAWLPRQPLIPARSVTKGVRVHGSCLPVDESVVAPEDVAMVINAMRGEDVGWLSDLGWAWAEANSWDALGGRWAKALTGERP